MDIPAVCATEIVKELGGVIKQSVNVMDSRGKIIASADIKRVGEMHAGAVRIIEEGLPILVVEENDPEHGVRAGINLPILFEGKVAGVVGVTGDPEALESHAGIIKKMTEILLVGFYQQGLLEKDNRRRTAFLQEWLFGGAGTFTEEFRDRGIQIGVDIRMPRRVMVVLVLSERRNFGTAEVEEVDQQAEKKLNDMANKENFTVLRMASRHVVLIGDCDDRQVLRIAKHIKNSLTAVCGIPVSVGIDQRSAGRDSLHHSYQQAESALRACIFEGDGTIKFYSDINIETVVTSVPKSVRIDYVGRIFKNLNEEETRYYISLLETFYLCDGSITQTAGKLYLHKNTVQYKLKKLFEKTGYDPRCYSHAALYGLAIHFHRYDDQNLY